MTNKTKIQTNNAPAAIGPYSQAIEQGNMVFLSGQIPLDPATAKIVDGGVAEQTEQVLANMEQVLKAAGLTFANVVKTTIFLADMADFATVNELYAKAFTTDPKPARSTVQVAALPLGVRVEIESIAIR